MFIRFFPLLVAAAWLIANNTFAADLESPAAVDLESYVTALIQEPDTASVNFAATPSGRFPIEWEKATPTTVPAGQKGLTVFARGYGLVRVDGALSVVREGPDRWPAVWQFFLWKLEGHPAMVSVIADFKCTARLGLDPCAFDVDKVLAASGLVHEFVCHVEIGNQRTWVYRVTPDGARTVLVAQTQGYLEGKGHLNAIHVIRSSIRAELESFVACTSLLGEPTPAASFGEQP